MAMLNIGNISAVTTQMLGNELGGVVASGVSTLLQTGGQDSLKGALGQIEKFFGESGPGGIKPGGSIPSSPQAFGLAMSGGGQASGLSNPFGSTQGLQPQMQGMIEGLNGVLGEMLGRLDTLGNAQAGLAQPNSLVGTNEMAKQFEMVMDQAMKLHLSGNAGDGLKAQMLFQQALGMLSGGTAGGTAGTAGIGGAGFSALGGGGFTGASSGAGAAGGGFTSTAGGASSSGGISAAGGGLDAMMSQAESLMRSDSMEAQLAGQRMMQKALRMFELISKLIEKQSEMASKAIAAIK